MSGLGTTLPVFFGLTCGIFGSAAWLAGQALAQNWRPVWQLLLYAMLLAAGDRFFDWALFGGDIGAPGGYVTALFVILALASTAYRATRARQMVRQYPWLYERAGPLAFRRRGG